MIEYRKGNLLDVKNGIILHGCNAQGVMGSGVALAVKQQYPSAFEAYKKHCAVYDENMKHVSLGTIAWAVENEGALIIANAITQESFGRDPQTRYVSYDAIDTAFQAIDIAAYTHKLQIHIPKIGAGLGNGDWGVIEKIIDGRCPKTKVICWEL